MCHVPLKLGQLSLDAKRVIVHSATLLEVKPAIAERKESACPLTFSFRNEEKRKQILTLSGMKSASSQCKARFSLLSWPKHLSAAYWFKFSNIRLFVAQAVSYNKADFGGF